ncbi:Lipopolysaccharide export system ATP-binding protein LptB [compost metagenome]
MSDADIQRILDELLRMFDLVGDREATGASLIMWKSRNLSFAKILATNPRLLLLDELFSKHSDPEARSVTAFINYAKAKGIGMLIAESGIKAEQALMLSDRGYVFANGRIVAEGTRDMLSATPEAQIAINL